MSVITDVTIVAGQRMGNRPVSVPTNQDTIKENSEHFKAILSLPERPSNVVVGVDTAFVTIIDGTGEHSIIWCCDNFPTHYCLQSCTCAGFL